LRLISILILAAFVGASTMAAGPAEDEASAAGQKWLSLLDDQKYEESWTQAGTTFRQEVMKDQWIDGLKQQRRPLGPLVARTASRVDFAKTLRGAPDGEYAIIHYKSELQNRTITERLTLVKEDGKWQVAAYAIH
jgi:hypothetical protein